MGNDIVVIILSAYPYFESGSLKIASGQIYFSHLVHTLEKFTFHAFQEYSASPVLVLLFILVSGKSSDTFTVGNYNLVWPPPIGSGRLFKLKCLMRDSVMYEQPLVGQILVRIRNSS